jgi:hypothetical protein
LQVSAAHHSTHALPVQPTPPVRPAKAKPEGHDDPPKVKASTPPHVGKKLDIHA